MPFPCACPAGNCRQEVGAVCRDNFQQRLTQSIARRHGHQTGDIKTMMTRPQAGLGTQGSVFHAPVPMHDPMPDA